MSGLWKSLRMSGKPLWIRLLAWSIVAVVTLGGPVAIAWDLTRPPEDQHQPPEYGPTGVWAMDICKGSMHPQRAVDAINQAEMEARELGFPALDVNLVECDGIPPRGHVQVRQCGDRADEPFDIDCDHQHFDVVGHRDGRVVVLWRVYDFLPCTPLHMVLHAHGVGHTTAASNVMHGDDDSETATCGNSRRWLAELASGAL